MRNVPVIDYAEAKKIVDLIVDKASRVQKSVVVAVADPHGELIAFARMDGAPISSIRIAANKAWTAARERKPTKEIGEKVRHPEKGHDIAYYGDPKFVGWGGGVPVTKNGEVVGAVAVSGLSSKEDAELARLGAESIESSIPLVQPQLNWAISRRMLPAVLRLVWDWNSCCPDRWNSRPSQRSST